LDILKAKRIGGNTSDWFDVEQFFAQHMIVLSKACNALTTRRLNPLYGQVISEVAHCFDAEKDLL
jgi:hypothetical protein